MDDKHFPFYYLNPNISNKVYNNNLQITNEDKIRDNK